MLEACKKYPIIFGEAYVYDRMKEGATPAEIEKETVLTKKAIIHIINKLKKYEAIAPLDEYFQMSSDIYPLIEKFDGKAQKQLPTVMSALWLNGITKRSILKKMPLDELDELCKGKQMRRAGYACIDALFEYKQNLKKVKLSSKAK